MESDRDFEAELRDADRAATAAWTDYPPTPSWYPAAGGAWAALLTLVMALPDEVPSIWRSLALLTLVVAVGAFVAWARRARGTWPNVGTAPAEFRPVITRFAVGVVAVLGAGLLAFTLVNVWVSAGVVLVGTTALLGWYERAYADAARRTRERLA